MAPRRKAVTPASKTRSAETAAPGLTPDIAASLAEEMSALESSLMAKVATAESDLSGLHLALTDHRRGTERLLGEAAGRLATVETTLQAIEQRGKDHDVAAATRRAAVSSRMQALEEQVRIFSDGDPNSSLVDDRQLSRTMRSVWVAVAGLWAAVAVLGFNAIFGR